MEDHKVKDIWIYGYNFDKVEELANTRFLELSLKLIGTSNVKINGIKKETFNNVVIENATSLVILDDNCGYNSSKIIDDIQKFTLGDLESHITNSKLPKLNNGSIEFPIKKLGKDNYNPLESFFDEEIIAHVAMAKPTSKGLGECCESALKKLNISHQVGGTYVVMEGPQFSTLAESNLYRSWKADVIGMTNMPEAKLA